VFLQVAAAPVGYCLQCCVP